MKVLDHDNQDSSYILRTEEESMISIAICDDDSRMRSYLEIELRKSMGYFGEKSYIEIFSNAQACLQQLKEKKFDLLLLDIEMPQMSGFSLAKRIQEKRGFPEISIIFVSAYENLVFDSYNYDALWFVRKKNLEVDLKKAIKKYLDYIYYAQLSFLVKNKTDAFKILYQDIFYFESNVHDIFIKTVDCTYQMGGSLKNLEREMAPNQFIRIHKSFLANIRHIYAINKDTITLTDNSMIPLSKERRAKVKKIFFERGDDHIMGK